LIHRALEFAYVRLTSHSNNSLIKVLDACSWLPTAASDLFQITPPDAASKASAHLSSSHSIFFCGNFGVILFNLFAQEECYNVLCKMTEVFLLSFCGWSLGLGLSLWIRVWVSGFVF
jgi:hypothetical protein